MYKENDRGLCDIEITEKIALEKLDGLRDDKAAGADDLVPRFLNSIKQELVSPLVISLSLLFSSGQTTVKLSGAEAADRAQCAAPDKPVGY